jgi:hypothetical protein
VSYDERASQCIDAATKLMATVVGLHKALTDRGMPWSVLFLVATLLSFALWRSFRLILRQENER